MLTLGFLALAGCGDDASENRKQDAEGPSGAGRVEARCEVGSRPDYHVKATTQPLVIGCAELPVSGKPVEFSANAQLFVPAPADRREGERPERILCINPAYRGRGGLGAFIPAVCPEEPLSRQLNVLTHGVPRQAVRGYERVILGTGRPSLDEVVVIVQGKPEQVEVFNVNKTLARELGAEQPFSVFVTEVPVESAWRIGEKR
jgi:hypothetical protein